MRVAVAKADAARTYVKALIAEGLLYKVGTSYANLRDAALEEKSFVSTLFLMPMVAMFVGDR
jgi:hypothetical protein